MNLRDKLNEETKEMQLAGGTETHQVRGVYTVLFR